MSKIALTPNASGTGTLTIAAPNTNTDRTLTLPDASGTLARTADIPAAYTNANALSLFNASGSAPVYACRAWVNFNGIGTVAIRASGNVSSITDNGVGNYTVNFTTAMPTADYCALVTSIPKGTGNNVNFTYGVFPGGTKTTTALQVAVGGASNATGFTVDYDQVNVAVFC